MTKFKRLKRFRYFLTAITIGWFLAFRQVKRSSHWSTVLIIVVMALTFLNLVVVSGILVGLIQGSENTFRARYTGDIIISTLKQKNYIEHSPELIALIKTLPWTIGVTARYMEGGSIEANYQTRINERDPIESAGAIITGINPADEEVVTGISNLVTEGQYLAPSDYDQIVIGYQLLRKYLPIDSPGLQLLDNVGVGSKVRLVLNDNTREYTVKGIIHGKVDEIGRRVFMVDSQLRPIIGRGDYNVDEISVRLKPGVDPNIVKQAILATGAGEWAKVQTWVDAQPKFLKDIKDTFALLGNMIGSIGLVVASITIFIVIFINAITRRKYIGILKGIGIDAVVIEFAYVIQSLFYASVGTLLGAVILFGVLQPYLAAHPIDFPFSDGILVATVNGTLLRVLALMVATLIAGYIPARIVVKQNTLDAILGR